MNKHFIVIVIILQTYAVYSQLLTLHPEKLSEDGRLTYLEIADKYGFPGIQENIITDDGYILTVFHIPGNASKPVLLIHGNTPTSDCWIMRGNDSLAITLAKLGYDVWAMNLRGTTYSRSHIYLDPDWQAEQFFNFSFYEQAIYDVPATIDFILQQTGQSQLTVIGHSVGTTLLYVLGAERPEYNDKVKIGISLAPISFVQNLRGIAKLGTIFAPELVASAKLIGLNELFSYKEIAPIFQTLCLGPLGYKLCIEVGLFSFLGSDSDGFEPEFTNNLFGHYPGGTTVKVLEHLGQVARGKKFAKFDYGIIKNLAVYGSLQPPEFDLKKVTMKSALFIGKEDYLGTVKDAELLNASLPNVVHYQVLPYERFNHADFIWGRYMPSNLYPYLLGVIKKYA